MAVLIIAEHDNLQLKPATRNVIQAAKQLPGPISVAVLGNDCKTVAEIVAKCEGVDTVILVEDKILAHPIAEAWVPTLDKLSRDVDYVLAPASTFGKNLLPRLASSLDVAPLTDVVEIKDGNTFIRPIYAGNALCTVRIDEPIKMLTIRSTAFEGCAETAEPCPIQKSQVVQPYSPLPEFIKLEESKSERPELGSANIVISGGRGLQSKENFKLIEDLADQLDAGIGASRAAVDAGFISNDHQIGQTGKVVAPNLYVAIGISGAIQHLAGMKDSKIIVGINKDSEAPIFQVTDYGLVGDLFVIVPELIDKLKQMKKAS